MKNIVKKAEDFVGNLFSEKLSPDLTYHNLDHTRDVVKAAEVIGKNSGLTDDEVEMLILAAWFHDSGFTEIYTGHEEKSVEICSDFLMQNRYAPDKIEKIKSIILVTRVDRFPENLIEMVIKDADLAYAGKDTFYAKSIDLRTEWQKYFNSDYTEYDWIINNINFLNETKFYTPYAKKIFNKQREKNLYELNSNSVLKLNNTTGATRDKI